MWRFHRYYVKELLVSLSLTFLILFGISLLVLVARGIYQSQGIDLLIGLWITFLWSVDAIPHVLSIAVLVAAVFTFGRAAAENEITAMRMAGTSPLRLILGVVLVGAVTATANAWLLHNVIPYVHYHKYRPARDLITQFLLSNRARHNKREFSQLSMVWDRRDGEVYHAVDFKVRAREGPVAGFAEQVMLETDPSGRQLRLIALGFRGEQEVTRPNGFDGAAAKRTAARIGRLVLTFDLREILEKGRRQEGLKDLSTAQLVSEVHGGGERRLHAAWYAWLRTCQALAAFLFAILGFPIGVIWQGSGRVVSFAISFVPIAGYYALVYTARSIARRSDAVWPVLLPDVVLAVAAAVLLRKAFRQ
ncbi:MAG: hypothetical protein CMJ85_09325 [Planctomycetes bacterium]|nr:hypothetical protein [Planctomycetota bacterium]